MALLGNFINKAYEMDEVKNNTPNQTSICPPDFGPKLQKNIKSQILVFQGYFNPPHVGHLRTLNDAYHRGGHDQNIIAAFIIPLNDSSVGKKLDRMNGGIRFDKQQRISLWRGHDTFPPWAIVYDKRSKYFKLFLSRLVSSLQDAGFCVEPIDLCGSDHTPFNYIYEGFYGRQLMLFDRAEPRLNAERQDPLQGFTSWKKLEMDDIVVLAKACEYARLETSNSVTGNEEVEEGKKKVVKGTKRERGATPNVEVELAAKRPKTGPAETIDANLDDKDSKSSEVGYSLEHRELKVKSNTTGENLQSFEERVAVNQGRIMEDLNDTWQCHNVEKPEVIAKFLAASETHAKGGFSSTVIREAIKQKTGQELENILTQMALSPQRLLEWIPKQSS